MPPDLTAFALVRRACTGRPQERPRQPRHPAELDFLRRRRRREVFVQRAGVGLGDVLVGNAVDNQALLSAHRTTDEDLVPGRTSRCGLAAWPLTSTFPALHAFCASERVRNRQATSSQMSRRTESTQHILTVQGSRLKAQASTRLRVKLLDDWREGTLLALRLAVATRSILAQCAALAAATMGPHGRAAWRRACRCGRRNVGIADAFAAVLHLDDL